MEYSVDREKAGKITIIQQIDPETDEVVNEFYSVRKAANANGIPTLYSNIAKACKTGATCHGFKWRYVKLNSEEE